MSGTKPPRRAALPPSRDCISVRDARLIACELRSCSKDLQDAAAGPTEYLTRRSEQVARILSVTAEGIERWATKVMMRRGARDRSAGK